MAGVFSAFLVAFKHLIPEHRIALLGNAVTIRVKVNNIQMGHETCINAWYCRT